jgi:hypothetical protein
MMNDGLTTRECSRVTCRREATTTLTYDYADSMIVVGPLSAIAEPHGYDLCAFHTERLSAPLGWHIVRHVAVD